MTDNIEKIVHEAECVAAADEYFKARTWLMDTNDNRRIFEAGFDRAYALLSKLRAPVADERAAFEAWAQKKKMPLARIGEQYDDFWVDHAWNGWQARAAHASAPEQPQGCPTDVCQASKADGVLCANDECDRANGVRPASAPVADARFRSNVEQLCAYAEGSKSANIVGTVRRVRAALASAPVAGEALTAEDVERQYRDGMHIGSGLPRATCPCGFCSKHRHGFERGDDLVAPQASAPVAGDKFTHNDDYARYLASAPVAGEAVSIADEAYAALQYVEGSLAAIANRREVVGDVIERVDTIAAAAKRAKAALSRLQAVAHYFDAAPQASEADPLQGAADWLMRAFEPPLSASDLARQLVIGYNRATRLRDAALSAQPGKQKKENDS